MGPQTIIQLEKGDRNDAIISTLSIKCDVDKHGQELFK